MTKETTKKKTASKVTNQNRIDEFISLAKDLKEIVVNLNQRMSEVEAQHSRIKQRLGL